MRITINDNNMQDSEEMRDARKALPTPPPLPGHNRSARRKLAKANKIFKDSRRNDWRMANEHMKRQNDVAQANAERIKEARKHQ